MSEKSCKYRCNICNKYYSSSNSLWNHNKKYHNTNIIPDNTNIILDNTLDNTYKCRYCNKVFVNYQNRWKHETKVCKIKNNKIVKLEEENKKLKEQLQTTNKNNKIITTNNTNTNSNNSTNNGTINNITINQFGKENMNALSVKDIKQLIKNNNYLVDIIKMLNFNDKYPENHNFCNTSLEGKYISVLNSDTNKIEKFNKNEFYDKVLCNSFDKMEHLSLLLEFDKEMKEKIKVKYKEHLDNKLIHINNIFHTNKVYKQSYKTNINELSYNNKDSVLDTWSNIPEIKNDDLYYESDDSINSKYSAFTTDSSDDEL